MGTSHYNHKRNVLNAKWWSGIPEALQVTLKFSGYYLNNMTDYLTDYTHLSVEIKPCNSKLISTTTQVLQNFCSIAFNRVLNVKINYLHFRSPTRPERVHW